MNFFDESPYNEQVSRFSGNQGFTLSNKRELTKFVNITSNGTYTILPDHPASESLSGVTINVSVHNDGPIVKKGYNTFLVPVEEGEEDQQVIEIQDAITKVVVTQEGLNPPESFPLSYNVVDTYNSASKTFIKKFIIIKNPSN